MGYYDGKRQGLNGEVFDYVSATPQEYSGYERGRLERDDAERARSLELSRQQQEATAREIAATRQRVAAWSTPAVPTFVPSPAIHHPSRPAAPQSFPVSSAFSFGRPASAIQSPSRKGARWYWAIVASVAIAIAWHACSNAQAADMPSRVEILDTRSPPATPTALKPASSVAPKPHVTPPKVVHRRHKPLVRRQSKPAPLPERAPAPPTSADRQFI